MRAVIALVIGLSVFSPSEITAPQPTLPTSSLSIETERRLVDLTVELATTPAQQERGLMFRKSLAADAGMLFLYRGDRTHTFWMKNTPIPLDILFVKANGAIVRIATNTKPFSEEPISSGEPVRAVLEIAGGGAALLGVRVGGTVRHPAFEK